MKKLITILPIILLANSYVILGQQDSLKSDLLTAMKKNEIGVNIAPLAIGFLGGFLDNPEFSITYKRMLSNQALRLAVYYRSLNLNPFDPGIMYRDDNSILMSETDSTEVRISEYSESYNLGIRVGSEWIKQKKKIKYYFGFDMNFALKNTFAFNSLDTLEKDSFCNNKDNFCFREQISSETYSVKEANSYTIGIVSFYGVKVPLSKKFLLTIQTGLEVRYFFGKGIYTDPSDYKLKTFSLSGYEFLIDNLVNDFSIFFLF